MNHSPRIHAAVCCLFVIINNFDPVLLYSFNSMILLSLTAKRTIIIMYEYAAILLVI